MSEIYSSEVVLKNTAEAVIVPLKDGVSSLNRVYEALIKADVDPFTGHCSNYKYIREQIVQAHQHLERSEQTASSGLKSLDENLERLTQDQGKAEREMNATKQTLDNLRTEQASNEKSLRDSQGALELARRNLNSARRSLQDQEKRKKKAKIVTGVGVGLFAIPVLGWFVGSAMVITGADELDQAAHAVKVAGEGIRESETEVKKYECKVPEYESKISQIKHDINQRDDKLKRTHEGIQKVKKTIQAVAEFQRKVRRAVQFLGVLSGRASVTRFHTRRFIHQKPVMKVMEDVMKATEAITGDELLYDNGMPRLINQMKENNQRLAAICASENNSKNKTHQR